MTTGLGCLLALNQARLSVSAQQGSCGRVYFDSIDLLINNVIVDPVKSHSIVKDMSGQYRHMDEWCFCRIYLFIYLFILFIYFIIYNSIIWLAIGLEKNRNKSNH